MVGIQRITVEYASGVRKAISINRLGAELRDLAQASAKLGLGLTLMVTTAGSARPMHTPQARAARVSRGGAKYSEDVPANFGTTEDMATPKKKRRRSPPINLKKLARASAREGFSQTAYARTLGVHTTSIHRALKRLNATATKK
jgi:transcriptional regulator with GAF, ATPase, and Fis domain